jgi:ubiquinone/menaquinone biosynthesis C-methylase UbiE
MKFWEQETMVDLHTRIREQPRDVLEVIASSMETRASEPAMQAICACYMSQIRLAGGGRVLEVGCGNGATTKLLMTHLDPAELVGVDPAPGFIEMADEAFGREPRASFHVGDAVRTEEPESSFDLVIAHTVYSHLPDPEGALREAYRVLKPGGRLAIFDGDYATITVELFDGDPLQAAVEAIIRNMVHAPYVMRSLPALATEAGFSVTTVEPHGYVQTTSPDYLLSLMSRSLDAAVRADEFGEVLSDGFKREAQRRVENGTFYGAILFLSVIAEKPTAV